jgi:hypothetical protein
MFTKLNLKFDEDSFRVASNSSIYGSDMQICSEDNLPNPEDIPPGTVKTRMFSSDTSCVARLRYSQLDLSVSFNVSNSFQTSGRDVSGYLLDDGELCLE